MHFAPLAVTSSRGTLRFEGDLLLADFLPEGLLSLTDLTAFADKRVDADVDLRRGDRSVVLSGTRFEIAGTAFDDFRLTAHARAASRCFSPWRPRWPGAASRARPSPRPALCARGRGPARGVVAGALDPALTRRPDRAGAGGRTPLGRSPFSHACPLTGISAIETDFRAARVASQDLSIADSTDPRNAASFSLLYAQRELSVEDIAAAWRGHIAGGSVQLRIGPASTAFDGSLVIDRQPYAFDGTWDPSLGLDVTGSHGLRIAARRSTGPTRSASRPAPCRCPSAASRSRLPGSTWPSTDPGADRASGGSTSAGSPCPRLPYGAGGACRVEARFTAVSPHGQHREAELRRCSRRGHQCAPRRLCPRGDPQGLDRPRLQERAPNATW